VTVTCLMPGATETEFFRRAGMMDTAIGTADKDNAAEVANNGLDAMMKGEGDVVSGFKNKFSPPPRALLPQVFWRASIARWLNLALQKNDCSSYDAMESPLDVRHDKLSMERSSPEARAPA
jgi:short-subunit dehydrogenase